MASLRGVALLIGPGLFSLTFAFFIAPEHRLPGAPWYLAAILMLVSLAVASSVARDKKSDKDKDEDASVADSLRWRPASGSARTNFFYRSRFRDKMARTR
jgi:hypothetical protein